MTAPNVLLSCQEPITNNRLLVMLIPTLRLENARAAPFIAFFPTLKQRSIRIFSWSGAKLTWYLSGLMTRRANSKTLKTGAF